MFITDSCYCVTDFQPKVFITKEEDRFELATKINKYIESR